ncbi:unnamed protein product [Citrullus colocynthis]|uniref:Uncharacterized protein n=1 Tax=Citrullus colocynthis TaxID=252529 RepID=A0ABP0XY32_9ROSI
MIFVLQRGNGIKQKAMCGRMPYQNQQHQNYTPLCPADLFVAAAVAAPPGEKRSHSLEANRATEGQLYFLTGSLGHCSE